MRWASSAQREPAHAVPGLFNHDNGPRFQRLAAVVKDLCQPLNHMRRSGVVEPQKDDAHVAVSRDGDNLAEIQVKRNEDAPLAGRLGEDLGVGQAMRSFVAQVHDIMAGAPEPFSGADGHAHVGQESHRAAPYGTWTSSWASQAAYSKACRMSSGSRSG